jgi:hypothetical protein
VHGGTAQGLGQALMERMVYDAASGQPLSASLMDYALPRAADLPPFVFETRNVPCRSNPLGVKGAGEAGAIGSCPAVMNAGRPRPSASGRPSPRAGGCTRCERARRGKIGKRLRKMPSGSRLHDFVNSGPCPRPAMLEE